MIDVHGRCIVSYRELLYMYFLYICHCSRMDKYICHTWAFCIVLLYELGNAKAWTRGMGKD